MLPRATAEPAQRVDRDSTSLAAASLVDRIIAMQDNDGAGFVVIDKVFATLYVFRSDGGLVASTPVLLGSAAGDHSVPGIGDRLIEDVRPEERTTPAGRFMGEIGYNLRGEDVVWVDYDAAVSMHRVLTTNKKERRLARLASPTPDDNRISYGCINVPMEFFETRLRPMFLYARAPIYVLPDTRAPDDVFQFQSLRQRPKGAPVAG